MKVLPSTIMGHETMNTQKQTYLQRGPQDPGWWWFSRRWPLLTLDLNQTKTTSQKKFAITCFICVRNSSRTKWQWQQSIFTLSQNCVASHLADFVNSLRSISCSNKKLWNCSVQSVSASGKAEFAVEPSGGVLGLNEQNNFSSGED